MLPDWHALIEAGDQIACSHMTSEPATLLQSLAKAAPQVAFGVALGVPFTMAAAALPRQVDVSVFGGMGSANSIARSRAVRVDMTPYSRCALAYANSSRRADIVLVGLARSADGRLWLGASHGYIVEAARRARQVVAEINAQAPCVFGAPWPDDIAIHVTVETSYAIAQLNEREPDGIEQQLARQVAGIVPDGACLQVGIGSTPSAMLNALANHRHLGMHSGMIGDGVLRLIQASALDNSRKPADSRTIVTGCVYGNESLYRFCDANEAFRLREPGYTHNAAVIARHADFTAINSAFTVDLLGQVNAETVTTPQGTWRYLGGQGGLNDFVRGARNAPRGQAIIALPSRTRPGSQGKPRIVARLDGPATVAAADADVIVTEHGVARLRDAGLDERVQQMLSIADPADRDDLKRSANAAGLLR